MELRPGYKQTEVGVRPEDWGVRPLGTFVKLRRGHDLTERARRKGEIPVMGSAGHNGFHDIALVRGPGLVLGRSGASFGQAHYCPTDFWPHNTALYVTDFWGNQPLFAFYFLKSLDFTRHNSGGAQQSLNRNFIGPIPVSVPDRKEQEAIAETLSDADALIESLEQLLTKKRQIKQGAMQELLTGKKRLPGFTGKWAEMGLDEIGHFLKGRGVSRDQSDSGDLPCVRYGELYTHHHEHLREYRSWISQDVAASATLIKQGDILFAGSGETKEEIGKCVAILSDVEAYAGGDIVILRTGYQDPRFLGHYLNTPAINRQKASRGQGDAVVHISGTALAGIRCCLPKMVEQTAIADILNDMDRGIAAIENKLTKARQIKQGMMQELLTGRIRLLQPSAEVLSFPVKESASIASVPHNMQINEAVVIAVLSARFGSENFPLGRFRRTKFSYLLHRHVEQEAAGFMKKAAGPYNPRTRYGGAEKIALQNRYVRTLHTEKGEGFVADENIAQAEGYFEKWYGAEALTWLEQFRYQKNDALELLTTVDMACEDLSRAGKVVTTSTVKQIIHDSPEWKAKLNRSVFSDDNIAATIETCRQLFSR